MLKLYYVGDNDRNVNSGIARQLFRIYIGVAYFYQTSFHIIFKRQIVTYVQKRGNVPTQINSLILKPLFCEFLGSFAIWGAVVTTPHLSHGCTPTNTFPTKISNGRCLQYVVFECHANFQIILESFAHRDQQKNIPRMCCP